MDPPASLDPTASLARATAASSPCELAAPPIGAFFVAFFFFGIASARRRGGAQRAVEKQGNSAERERPERSRTGSGVELIDWPSLAVGWTPREGRWMRRPFFYPGLWVVLQLLIRVNGTG